MLPRYESKFVLRTFSRSYSHDQIVLIFINPPAQNELFDRSLNPVYPITSIISNHFLTYPTRADVVLIPLICLIFEYILLCLSY